MLTTAGEKDGCNIAIRFEQIRQLFLEATTAAEGSLLPFKIPLASSGPALTWLCTTPVRVIVFGSEKEFRPYKFTESSAAYTVRGFRYDYIVLSKSNVDSLPVALHEYLHLVVRYSGANLPLWANARSICFGCQKPAPHYDRSLPRLFEFVRLWGIAVFFEYARWRVHCRRYRVRVEALPWVEGKRTLTTTYMHFLAVWARRMS